MERKPLTEELQERMDHAWNEYQKWRTEFRRLRRLVDELDIIILEENDPDRATPKTIGEKSTKIPLPEVTSGNKPEKKLEKKNQFHNEHLWEPEILKIFSDMPVPSTPFEPKDIVAMLVKKNIVKNAPADRNAACKRHYNIIQPYVNSTAFVNLGDNVYQKVAPLVFTTAQHTEPPAKMPKAPKASVLDEVYQKVKQLVEENIVPGCDYTVVNFVRMFENHSYNQHTLDNSVRKALNKLAKQGLVSRNASETVITYRKAETANPLQTI